MLTDEIYSDFSNISFGLMSAMEQFSMGEKYTNIVRVIIDLLEKRGSEKEKLKDEEIRSLLDHKFEVNKRWVSITPKSGEFFREISVMLPRMRENKFVLEKVQIIEVIQSWNDSWKGIKKLENWKEVEYTQLLLEEKKKFVDENKKLEAMFTKEGAENEKLKALKLVHNLLFSDSLTEKFLNESKEGFIEKIEDYFSKPDKQSFEEAENFFSREKFLTENNKKKIEEVLHLKNTDFRADILEYLEAILLENHKNDNSNLGTFSQNYLFRTIIKPLAYEKEIKEHIEVNIQGLGSLFGLTITKILDISFPKKEPVSKLRGGCTEETHYMGRKTKKVKVKFISNNEEYEKNIFYKPRSAEIDKAVLDYLGKYNDSGEKKLFPTEKDIVIFNGGGKEQYPYSFWTEVEGDLLPSGVTPIDSLKCSKDSKKLVPDVIKLDRVLSFIGISDLHGENLIISNNKIIPIDLEVVNPGYLTLLLGGEPEKRDKTEPSENEKERVSNFQEVTENIEKRIVFLETKSSVVQVNFDSYQKYLNLFLEGLKKDSRFYPPNEIQLKNLKRAILQSALYCDIPCFTLKGNELRFRTNEGNIIIAEKKSDKLKTMNNKGRFL